MYLKRLEIQGFKSFPARTAFEFGAGITVIVGPNGSGKSNVADALRWVLGEQSGRALRARKTEQVIFAGSGRRGPLGMAEVSVTLDNGSGWLPIDFAEVVLTRRAYRSGENEYLINGARVRLRDVQEMLQASALGQSSYSFMAQGMVDLVLSQRPQERRALIEEAAGVRHHQARLEEAADRLAATLENIERVNLLIGELTPRMNQLERQARRASEQQRLSEELAAALRELFGLRWEAGEEVRVAASAVYDQRAKELQDAEASVRQAEAQLAGVRGRLTRAREDAAEKEAERAGFERQLARLEQNILLDRERHSMVSSRREELQVEVELLEQERLALSESALGDGRRELALDQQVEAAQAALASEQQLVDRIEAEAAAARRRLVEVEEQALRARSSAAEARRRAERLEEQAAKTTVEEAELRHRLRDQARELTETARRLRALRDEEARLHDEQERLQREQRLLGATARREEEAVQRVRGEMAGLAREREMLAARLELLRKIQAELQGFDAGVRAIFEAAESEHGAPMRQDVPPLRGVLGVVARLLRVAPGMERAIEAALAENLQAVVIERQADALAALKLLVSERAGRAFVLPRDALRHTYPVQLQRERGVIGVASSLVRCDAAYRPLVETLLGRTVVVEDVETAQAMVRRGLGSAVTVDGILVRHNGSMFGGAGDGESNVFQREQELLALPESLADLDSRLQGRAAELERVLNRFEEAQTRATRALARLEGARQREAEVRQALAEARARLAPLRGEVRWSSAVLHRLAGQTAELREEQARLRRDAEEQESQAAAAADATALERRAAVDAVEERRKELLHTVAEASAVVARHEGERRTLALLREKQEESIKRLEGQVANKRLQAKNLELEASVLSARVEAAQRELGELSRRAREAGEALTPRASLLTGLEKEAAGAEELLAAARSALLDAERRALEAESELQRRLDELEALQRAMEAEGYLVSDGGRVIPRGEFVAEPPSWLAGEPAADGERIPPVAGGAGVDIETLERRIAGLRERTRALGPVNAEAAVDYREGKERVDFLTGQLADLQQAEGSLREAIAELQGLIAERFQAAFARVNVAFAGYFAAFFSGGQAQLELVEADDGDQTPGVEILAQPPGKRVQALAMLSGGERALTAIALLFALLNTNPSPFCIMDEVDAALDEANVGRFAVALKELAATTQFVVITHNRRTIEQADAIFGVSMADDGGSRVLSLRLSDLAPA